jgi:co-chaperonin GroES (HSP10)
MQVFTPATHPPEFENNTVLIIRDADGGDTTPGSLIVKPQQAVEIANQGEVRAVAADSRYSVGQRIVFVKYAGSQITLNGIEYTLLKEKEIQGTVETIGEDGKTAAETKEDLQAALAKFEAEIDANKNS